MKEKKCEFCSIRPKDLSTIILACRNEKIYIHVGVTYT